MINVFGSCVGSEELAEVADCIDRQWLGIGVKTEKFERLMAQKTGLGFTAVDSGSNALYMAVKALKLKPGSEVIIPSITWIACATAVIEAGLKPVFADVDWTTCSITQESASRKVTGKTGAVMVVHYSGYPVEFSIGGIYTIGDCAHAVDSYICGVHVAKFCDISIFSFDSIKNIAAGELGGICSASKKFSRFFKESRYCGLVKSGIAASAEKDRWWCYELKRPFIKMLPNDITASIAIAQFKKLEIMQSRRRQIWNLYQQAFEDISWIERPPEASAGNKHSYFTYAVKVLNGRRDALARYLLDKWIYTTVRYEPLHLYSQFRCRTKLPVAEKLGECLLNLPLHPKLSDSDISCVTERVRGFK